jgi:transcriptional regulator with XRE-family HTH domain
MKVIIMKSIGSRLRAAREKKGWTQTYVCKKLGLSNSTLSGYERDYRKPDPEQIRQFAELYEVSTDYLLGRDDQPNTTNEVNDELNEKEIAELERIANDEKIILTAYGKKLDPEDEILARQLLRTIAERARAKREEKNG